MAVLNFYCTGRVVPENAVYIGRANPTLGLAASPLANPFRMKTETDRDRVVASYRTWLWQQLQSGALTEQHLLALEGKDLVCYCAPKACHGDVVTQAVAWAVRRRDQGLTGSPIAPLRSSSPSTRTVKP